MNAFFDDMKKMAGGAMNSADAMRHEASDALKAKMTDFFKSQDLVTREEFEVQQELLQKAMAEIEALKLQVMAHQEPGNKKG